MPDSDADKAQETDQEKLRRWRREDMKRKLIGNALILAVLFLPGFSWFSDGIRQLALALWWGGGLSLLYLLYLLEERNSRVRGLKSRVQDLEALLHEQQSE